jgi:hypothetical protein
MFLGDGVTGGAGSIIFASAGPARLGNACCLNCGEFIVENARVEVVLRADYRFLERERPRRRRSFISVTEKASGSKCPPTHASIASCSS